MFAEKEIIWKTKTKMRNMYVHYYPEITAI